jgi:methylglyoxal reductase
MITKQLGKSSLEVTPIIMGTWALGGWLWGGTDKNRPEDAILASIDAGINCIDTAPIYGFGLSEELVGKAIKGRRDDVLIATKCGMVWEGRSGGTDFFDATDAEGKSHHVKRCLTKSSILSECDDSLRRLGIDVIDLYQCHWPDASTDIDETMDALVTLHDQGKIREFGVSNFSVEDMTQCLQTAAIASDQPKYNLLAREIEEDVLPFCIERGVGVIVYSPMEMGLLTGKVGMDREFPDNDTRKNRPWFQPEKRREVLAALEEVRPIAEAHDASFAQLSVAWTIAQPGVTAALVGARDAEQAKTNAAAGDLTLTVEEEAAIRAVFNALELDEPVDPAKVKR